MIQDEETVGKYIESIVSKLLGLKMNPGMLHGLDIPYPITQKKNPNQKRVQPFNGGDGCTPPGKDRWRSQLPLVLVYHGPLRTLPPFGGG